MKTPRFWQQSSLISHLLAPAALLYRAGAWLDRRFTTPRHAPLPVIAIGNVTAGGAGKTPTTLALIPILAELGHTPHILTRGYHGGGEQNHRVDPANDHWHNVGDEALLLAYIAPTWIGGNRHASANAAAANGASIVVCDDAIQHHALHKDISLLVIDGPYGIGNGKLLPAGPLRETLASAASRADAAIIIGADVYKLGNQLTIPVFRAQLRPAGDTGFLAHGHWLAFAGIGRPEKFYTSLRELGAHITATRDFADHHAYSADDEAWLATEAEKRGAQLITTTKDAVKLSNELLKNVNILNISVWLEDPASFRQFLAQRLASVAT